MPGETVLLIEDSSAERDIAQTILEDAGYRVVAAANAAAALTYPDIQDVNLVVMDALLGGVSGFETTRMLRREDDTFAVPILVLIPEDQIGDREDVSARGADGFLLKPYDHKTLANKVQRLLAQRQLDDITRNHLSEAADHLMDELADKHIKEAVDRKTQIIIERCIQTVVSTVDDQVREEINQRVTTLTAEKEQALVEVTVREVASSMVEKIAEHKIDESLEELLPERVGRAVTRMAEEILPDLVRERLKESMNHTLPREIQTRLTKATEEMAPELSKELIATVEQAANRSIPKMARDLLPAISERHYKITTAEKLPKMVKDLVARELEAQINQHIRPVVNDHVRRLRRTVLIWNAISSAFVAAGLAAIVYLLFFTH